MGSMYVHNKQLRDEEVRLSRLFQRFQRHQRLMGEREDDTTSKFLFRHSPRTGTQ